MIIKTCAKVSWCGQEFDLPDLFLIDAMDMILNTFLFLTSTRLLSSWPPNLGKLKLDVPGDFARFYRPFRLPSSGAKEGIDDRRHFEGNIFKPHGLYSLRRRRLTGIGIPIINLRRSDDRLRFIMGIPILIRERLLSEQRPWWALRLQEV